MHINGKELAIEIDGEGPAILFIGGLGSASSAFQLQADLLGDWFRIIRPDLEGSGRSALTGPLSISEYVSDLVALLDTLGEERVRVVGHSLGSLIGRELARLHPDRVEALVLLGAVGVPADRGAALRRRADSLRRDGVGPAARDILRVAIADFTRRERPVASALVRTLMMSQDREGYACSYEALAAATDPGPVASDLPLLLIVGEHDRIGPPSVSEAIAQLHGSAPVRVIADTGHWPMIEAYDVVGQYLQEFFESFRARV